MQLYFTSFLQTAQGNMAFTFPVLPLLIIVFVFLQFTSHPLIPFYAPSLFFRHSSASFSKVKSLIWSCFSGNLDQISLDSTSSTTMKIKDVTLSLDVILPGYLLSSMITLTLTRLRSFLYIYCTILTNHSSIPSFLKICHYIFRFSMRTFL